MPSATPATLLIHESDLLGDRVDCLALAVLEDSVESLSEALQLVTSSTIEEVGADWRVLNNQF